MAENLPAQVLRLLQTHLKTTTPLNLQIRIQLQLKHQQKNSMQLTSAKKITSKVKFIIMLVLAATLFVGPSTLGFVNYASAQAKPKPVTNANGNKNTNTPPPAAAPQSVVIDKIDNPFGNNAQTVPGIVNRVIVVILGLIIIAAVVVIIVAGFKMVLSGGNPEQIKNAKKSIIWAIVGLVVAFMSFAIVSLIQKLL